MIIIDDLKKKISNWIVLVAEIIFRKLIIINEFNELRKILNF